MQRVKSKSNSEVPLSHLVNVLPMAYPSTNIEHDSISLLEHYIPSASTLEIIERFSTGLRGAKNGRILSITGPYGSGKSTMAIFLKGLFAPNTSKEWKTSHKILKKEPQVYVDTINLARRHADIDKKGMIRCTVMARREPLSVTILRGLEQGFADYFGNGFVGLPNKELFEDCLVDANGMIRAKDIIKIIEDAAKVSPILIMIDEFGKNIEYFTSDESQQSDLFLLQELAERSGKSRKIPLSIITLQHMAFEEYAIGASTAQKKEWSKIQGRFEDIPFVNSPEQTRQLVVNTIKMSKNPTYRKDMMNWATKESKKIRDIGLQIESSPELIASYYPLSPIVLEVIPELCSRYGQRERTLLSFISDSKNHTAATFIDLNYWNSDMPPVMGLDSLYDFFISGTSIMHSTSQNISRLMEIETIIRDAHGLSDIEKRTLKIIGVLNLIGRSGHLRASRRVIDYCIEQNSRQILNRLEKRSIITYRRHADEYRLWHGTDIDIAAKLKIYRSRYKRALLIDLLKISIKLEPIVAAKHSIKTGTMRIFERRFTLNASDVISENFDGVVLYLVDDEHVPLDHKKPVIAIVASNTTNLKLAAIEVCAIQDILNSEDDIVNDWVAKRELKERFADAEVILDREFARAFDRSAKWIYKNNVVKMLDSSPSNIVSQVCDDVYNQSPIIQNEMINRTNISTQGSSAKKTLLGAMILHHEEEKFGIIGHGPDIAVYEAIFFENKIHVHDSLQSWKLVLPKNAMRHVWNAMLNTIKKSKSRITLHDVYKVVKMPPYGIRDGPLQLIFLAMFLVNRTNIALYEHGTFVPKIRPEIAERMTKNPEHFEVKYFKNSSKHKAILGDVAKNLNLSRTSLLDVVGYLVRTVSTLPPYVKSTKKMDKKTIRVRDNIMTATEPDTLLFKLLPRALELDIISDTQNKKFAKLLAKSINTLQDQFTKSFKEIHDQLFNTTGITDRVKLSKVAKAIQPYVVDQKMKVFLGALSADVLEKDEDWINYVAMSLTDVPPTDWTDEQRTMFNNNLQEYAYQFKRMISLHFQKTSDGFEKYAYQITITRTDGSEQHEIISFESKKKKKMDKIVQKMKDEMYANGFTDHDVKILDLITNQNVDS